MTRLNLNPGGNPPLVYFTWIEELGSSRSLGRSSKAIIHPTVRHPNSNCRGSMKGSVFYFCLCFTEEDFRYHREEIGANNRHTKTS
jgi:hypothetical protein